MIKLEALNKMDIYTLYTTKEISELLSINEATIKNWIRRGLPVNAIIGGKAHILGKDLANYWERFVKKEPKQKKSKELIEKLRNFAKEILETRELIPKRPYKEIADKFDMLEKEVEYIVNDIFPKKENTTYKNYINSFNLPALEKVALFKKRFKFPDLVKHLGVYFYSPRAYETIKHQK